MEHQTGFNLNGALENWRQELGSQAALTADNRRELETHLRDALAELQTRGLNDEESFWLARRRVGQPQQIAEEFAKADPVKVWRERAFWIVCGILVLHLLGLLVSSLSVPIYVYTDTHFMFKNALPDWVLFYLPHWVQTFSSASLLVSIFIKILYPVLVFLIIVLAVGKNMTKVRSALELIFESRARFAISVSLLTIFVVIAGGAACGMWLHSNANEIQWRYLSIGLDTLFWFPILIALAAWLFPSREAKPAAAEA